MWNPERSWEHLGSLSDYCYYINGKTVVMCNCVFMLFNIVNFVWDLITHNQITLQWTVQHPYLTTTWTNPRCVLKTLIYNQTKRTPKSRLGGNSQPVAARRTGSVRNKRKVSNRGWHFPWSLSIRGAQGRGGRTTRRTATTMTEGGMQEEDANTCEREHARARFLVDIHNTEVLRRRSCHSVPLTVRLCHLSVPQETGSSKADCK